MKKLITLLVMLGAFAAHSAEIQLHECKFGKSVIDFTPSSALTAILQKELKGSAVYVVKYKRGRFVTGPRHDLAVVEELPSKTLGVTFFEHDEVDGIIYSRNSISIDLKEPVALDAPTIFFSADFTDGESPSGKCSLSLI